MLHNILPVIVDDLNQYLSSNYDTIEERAVLSGIVNQEGKVAVQGENKIICTLVNLEEERVYKSPMSMVRGGNVFGASGGALNLNFFLLFSAYFTDNNYAEALKFLSATMQFFQSKPVFERSNTPLLSANAERLSFEVVNLGFHEQTNLWATLGAKYMPSILYKVRMITIHEDMIKEEIPAVTGLQQDVE